MSEQHYHDSPVVVSSGGGGGSSAVGIVAIVVLVIVALLVFGLFFRPGTLVLPRGLIEIFVPQPPQQQQPLIVPVPVIQPTQPTNSNPTPKPTP